MRTGGGGRQGWRGGRLALAGLAIGAVAGSPSGSARWSFPPTGYKAWVLEPVPGVASSGDGRCVVLLHGLARTSRSLRPMARAIAARGTPVVGVDYPSRAFPVETLAPRAIARGFGACRAIGARRIDVVTHSMGAILLREAIGRTAPADLGRTVMLAPPNAGSEVVDVLAGVPGFAAFNGPAGLQLGTGAAELPARLGPTRADVAVIAGSRTINPLLSLLLPNPDDGKVSAPRTRLDGMCAWLTVPATHPLMMRKALVIAEALRYLETGRFASPAAEYPECPGRLAPARERRAGGDRAHVPLV